MSIKTAGVAWFTTSTEHFGIVVALDEITNQLKAYIGVVPGGDEEDDIELIKAYGAKFPVEVAIQAVLKSGSVHYMPGAFTQYPAAW